MSKISKACDISDKVRKQVLERDGYCSILSGKRENIQIAHYISRAGLGLGIPENLVCLTAQEHYDFDNGNKHIETKTFIENYLKHKYPNWDEKKLVYRKE